MSKVHKRAEDTIVLIDMDDTIEYLLKSWCSWLNEKYGTNMQDKDITEWHMTSFFPSLTTEQVLEPLHLESFWKTVKPMPDAIEYVKKLVDDGFQVYICTSTDYRNIRAKYEYVIQKHFPFIKWNHIIIANDKQMINGDFLVDDGVHNLEGGTYKKVLFTAPHNKNYDAEANGMFRANNWREIYDFIKKSVAV